MLGSGSALAKPFDQPLTGTSGTALPSRSLPVASGPASARDRHRGVPRVAVHGDRVTAAALLAVDQVLVGPAVVRPLRGGERPVRGGGVLLVPQRVPHVARQVGAVGGLGDRLRAGAGEAVVAGAVRLGVQCLVEGAYVCPY